MSSSRWGHQNHFKSTPEIWGIFRLRFHVMIKWLAEIYKKKNFFKPRIAEPAMQNSVNVVNVSLQMKT